MSNNSYNNLVELIKYRDSQRIHYMPNIIFEDLQTNIKKSPHVSFAYSYYYLTSWLYRNAKYGEMNMSVGTIKEILRYKKDSKTINYIIKENGVLDEMKYTKTVSDFPVEWYMVDKMPFFILKSERYNSKRVEKFNTNNRFRVKYPIKHFHFDEYCHNLGAYTGLFYEASDSHLVDFEVFLKCMSTKSLETTGFYLYAYLKNKNQSFQQGYDVSLVNLSKESGIPERTLVKYINALREYQLISVKHNQEYFSTGIAPKSRMANTYITNEPYIFLNKPKEFRRMPKVTPEEHTRRIESKLNDNSFDNLPF